MLVFGEWEKSEYLKKNLSQLSEEPTNSVHIFDGWSGNRTRATMVLFALRQPCFAGNLIVLWFVSFPHLLSTSLSFETKTAYSYVQRQTAI